MSQIENQEWPLPSRGFGNCFGCAPNNTKGLNLRIWYTRGGCKSYHSISEEHCGFEGLAHGGIIATLLDEVAAWTIITHLQQIGITIEATVRYLKPVPTGVQIIIEGKIRERREEKVEVITTILSQDKKVLAEAESSWFLPSPITLQKITGMNADELDHLVEEIIGPIANIKKNLNSI
jgi:uncharacterized protein (TIGR00369 family)